MCLRKLKMCSTRIYFVFALFWISSGVICEKKLCDLDDNKCLTEGAAQKYDQFISGMPGVESSEPLCLDLFEVNQPSLKYKVINGSLSGMKNCRVELVQVGPMVKVVIQISQKEKKYHFHVGCPHLVFESKYEVEGTCGPQFVEGKGTCRIFYFDYNFLFNGEYAWKDCNDRKKHIQLKNSNLELEAKGKVHYDFQNLFNGNKAKSAAAHKFVNENWQYVDKLVREPVTGAFMKKYIDNVNAYLRKVLIEEVLSEDYSRPFFQ